MRMVGLLVIILIVDENRVLTFKLERQAPVSADADRPVVFEFSGQRVELPSRGVHVPRPPSIVRGKQLQAQFAGMLRLNSSLRSGAEEFLHPAMPEAFDHYV